MDKTKQLIGERISERSLVVSGPERKVDEFIKGMAYVDGVWIVARELGDTPDDVGSATFLFAEQADPLLTLLPPIGTTYTLGLQEEA